MAFLLIEDGLYRSTEILKSADWSTARSYFACFHIFRWEKNTLDSEAPLTKIPENGLGDPLNSVAGLYIF